jgi:GntR family transcriptional regulator of arabinose operon
MAEKKLSSKREQVRRFILESIAKGLDDNDKLWPEYRLVKELGVSKSTVRKAVESLVEDGVIVQKQGKGTFVKNASHSLVRAVSSTQGIKTIGFVSAVPHYEIFLRDITLGIEEELDHSRFLLINKYVQVPFHKEEDVLKRMTDIVDGFIVLSTMSGSVSKALSDLHNKNIPIVYIDRYPDELDCQFVTTDNEEGGVIATEHLIKNGHKKILYLSNGRNLSSVHMRIKGYSNTMKRYGFEPWIEEATPDNEFSLYKKLDKVISSPQRPTAIFCVHDSFAMKTCDYLMKNGIRVPEDISVVGFDNNDDTKNYTPALTTIEQPKRQVGRKAAQLIQSEIARDKVSLTHVFLQPKLIERSTVAKI